MFLAACLLSGSTFRVPAGVRTVDLVLHDPDEISAAWLLRRRALAAAAPVHSVTETRGELAEASDSEVAPGIVVEDDEAATGSDLPVTLYGSEGARPAHDPRAGLITDFQPGTDPVQTIGKLVLYQ